VLVLIIVIDRRSASNGESPLNCDPVLHNKPVFDSRWSPPFAGHHLCLEALGILKRKAF
jgi:hypothetical protein